MTDFIFTLFSAALVNNVVLQQPLALGPLLSAGQSPPRTRLHGLGATTCVLLVLSTLLGSSLYDYLLMPLQLEYLSLFAFVPLIVALVKPVQWLLAHAHPDLADDLPWPLPVGNAAVLGVLLLSTASDKGPIYATALGLGAGLGFWLVLSLFDDLVRRIDFEAVPQPFRGLPLQLISLGLMGMAFMAFDGWAKS